jgi:hypothetical protein
VVRPDRDACDRRDIGFLTYIQEVVQKFLQHYQRPLSGLVSGLGDQFLAGEEIQLAAGAKDGPLQ